MGETVHLDQDGVATSTYEQIRQQYLNYYITPLIDERAPQSGDHSEFGLALNAITRAAVDHTKAVNGDERLLRSLLERGVDVVQSLRFSVQPLKQQSKNDALRLWSHRRELLYDVQSKQMPYFDRAGIEAATGEYLELPYRATYIDRLLTDVLVAVEIYQFFDDLANEFVFPGEPPRSPFKRAHPLTIYLRDIMIYGLISLGLCIVIWHFHHNGTFSDGLALGGYLTSALLFLVCLVWETISLRHHWRSHTTDLQRVKSLMNDMMDCYRALVSDGPISVRHVSELLKAAAANGAVWPAPLYALLEDVLKRSGRI
jgi:hypothetical protein